MSTRFRIKITKNDNAPTLTGQLYDQNTGLPIDLSASATTVTLKIRRKGTSTILQTLTGTKIDDGSAGIVQFQPSAFAYTQGTLEGELTLLKGGLTQTAEDYPVFRLRNEF